MEKLNFEASLKRLDEIVKLLESGECSLDDSFKLFEEGTTLSKECYKTLETAKQKISEFTQNEKE